MHEAFGVHFLKTLIGKALNLVWDEDAKLSTAAFDLTRLIWDPNL